MTDRKDEGQPGKVVDRSRLAETARKGPTDPLAETDAVQSAGPAWDAVDRFPYHRYACVRR